MDSTNSQSSLEIIVSEPDEAIRWAEHGYPSPLARWHYHPEIEIHLIREGSGYMMAGDGMIPFHSGQVAMLGANVPHNWISDLEPGQVLRRRDVLCQIHPNHLRALAGNFPEAAQLYGLLRRAQRAIVLEGEVADHAASLLESMGAAKGLDRLIVSLELLSVFACAPESQWINVVTSDYKPDISVQTANRINTVLSYINAHLSENLSLEEVAHEVAMSGPAFSRFFKHASGISFSDIVRRLRIARACRLLDSTDYSVSRIQSACGYTNTANFNRRFRQETGMTPSQYRHRYRGNIR